MIWLSVKREVFMQNFQNRILENSTFKRDHWAGGLPNGQGGVERRPPGATRSSESDLGIQAETSRWRQRADIERQAGAIT